MGEPVKQRMHGLMPFYYCLSATNIELKHDDYMTTSLGSLDHKQTFHSVSFSIRLIPLT